jgi:ubiquinone/menaquinone biosynthesis C-methylase UbiE
VCIYPSVMQPTFTGERVVPGGTTPVSIFSESEHRYNFASQFVVGKTVLDIACGSGIGSSFLLESGASRVTGVDIDRPSLETAARTYPGVDFKWGDASREIPLPNESVDVVVSFETIEHFANQDRFLEECRRVLRSSGTFICSSPNRDASRWFPPSRFHVKEFGATEFLAIMGRHFEESATLAQRELYYPALVLKAIARAIVEAIGVKELVKRLLHIRPAPTVKRDRFVQAPHGLVRYRRRLLRQPLFLIYVGEKA